MDWKELQKRTYTPFSDLNEVCVIEGSSGAFYPGVRIENGSFPLSIDAEQAAIGFCYTQQDEPEKIYYPDNQEPDSYWINELNLEVIIGPLPSDIVFPNVTEEISDDNIYSRLKDLNKRAKSPNSSFSVSAFLKTENGWFPGVNIEFSDWQKGLCAERVAISGAISSGYKNFTQIAIYANKGSFISPCGGCRQVMLEQLPEGKATLYHPNDSKSTHRIADFLPYAFKTLSL